MVFDPVKMKWLKAARHSTDPRSPSEFDEDEEDPFAGIEDFKDNESVAGRATHLVTSVLLTCTTQPLSAKNSMSALALFAVSAKKKPPGAAE
jgi:hypothetical protein